MSDEKSAAEWVASMIDSRVDSIPGGKLYEAVLEVRDELRGSSYGYWRPPGPFEINSYDLLQLDPKTGKTGKQTLLAQIVCKVVPGERFAEVFPDKNSLERAAITLTINGRAFEARETLEEMMAHYERHVEERALEIFREKFSGLFDKVSDFEAAITAELRKLRGY